MGTAAGRRWQGRRAGIRAGNAQHTRQAFTVQRKGTQHSQHPARRPALTFFQAQWRANRAGTLSTGTPLVSGSIQYTKQVMMNTQPAKLHGREGGSTVVRGLGEHSVRLRWGWVAAAVQRQQQQLHASCSTTHRAPTIHSYSQDKDTPLHGAHHGEEALADDEGEEAAAGEQEVGAPRVRRAGEVNAISQLVCKAADACACCCMPYHPITDCMQLKPAAQRPLTS